MDLSVIIVSYNVRQFLEQCLLSVRKAAEGLACEIFVVDNNSSDGSCDMVGEKFHEARLIRNSSNRGFSAANNQALEKAAGRYILLLNPDTIVGEGTFSRCISFMDAHPDAGALGVSMFNGLGKFLPESKRALPTPMTAFFKMTGLSYLFPRSGIINRYYLGHLDNTKTTRADVIPGAFMFLRAEAVAKAGLLDEDFFMFGEDIDYSLRLLRAGYNNYFFPEARVTHFKGRSTAKENLKAVRHFYRAMSIYVRKHYSTGFTGFFSPALHAAIFVSCSLSLTKAFIRNLFHSHSCSITEASR